MAGVTGTTGWRSTDDGASWAYPAWNGVADNTVYMTTLGLDGKLYGAGSNVHDMYASILAAGALGYALNVLFLVAERRIVHWSGR